MRIFTILAVAAATATPALADRDNNLPFGNDVMSISDFAGSDLAAKDGYINDINGTVRR